MNQLAPFTYQEGLPDLLIYPTVQIFMNFNMYASCRVFRIGVH